MPTDPDTSRLLHRVCHDLRTPVRGIRAHAELLLKDSANGPPADFEQRLEFIVNSARQMDLFVEGLSSYINALEINPDSFLSTRLDVLLRGALAKLANTLRESGAEVTHGELPRLHGNPDWLIQLFVELIRNAMEHRGEATPKVHIGAKQEDDLWTICVRDNGPGMEAGDLERAFLPFERLHGRGPGLGLATSRAIVAAHRGRIWAESSGEGLTVCFTLPA